MNANGVANGETAGSGSQTEAAAEEEASAVTGSTLKCTTAAQPQ